MRTGLQIRRKLFLVITELLVLALLIGGCVRSRLTQANEPVILVFKHAKHPRYAELSQLIHQFEAENPHIRVREENLPTSTDEQHQFYVINLAAHTSDFDVLDMDVIWVPEFARAGWLGELSPYLAATKLEPLNPSALRADWIDRKLYAVPWFVDAGVLYYRKDLLRKYGLSSPQTYPQLLEEARKILAAERNPSLVGFVWQGMQYEGLVCAALEFVRGNGGRLLRDDLEPALTEPATLEALHFMSDLIRKYDVTPTLVTTLNEEATRHIFQSGRAIFMRNWPYAWRLLNEPGSPVAGRVGMTLIPHFAGHASVPTLGGFHLGVSAYSQHKTEAVAFLRFMIRYGVQKEVLLKLGVLPAHVQVYRDPEVQRVVPFLTDLLPSLDRVQPRPVTPYYLMISQIVQPELSAILVGVRSPEQAMRLAEQGILHLREGP